RAPIASEEKEHKKPVSGNQKNPKNSSKNEEREVTTSSFQPKDSRSPVLLRSGNGIRGLVPVPTTLVRSVLFSLDLNKKHPVIFSEYTHDQKIRFPFFLTMEKSRF